MSGKQVLIVDDEESIRDMLRLALEMAGYECLEAETAAAHALIIEQHLVLVLLDWMLPGTSGIDLVRRLKKDALTSRLPIVVLTAKGEEKHKLLGLDSGADDYITKPFLPRELLARLKAVLHRASMVTDQELINVHDLVLNPVSHRITASPLKEQNWKWDLRSIVYYIFHDPPRSSFYSRSVTQSYLRRECLH